MGVGVSHERGGVPLYLIQHRLLLPTLSAERANMARKKQPRRDSGLGFQVNALQSFGGVPSSLESGNTECRYMSGLRPATPGRARLGMTLEPLLWLYCSISGRCLLEINHRNSVCTRYECKTKEPMVDQCRARARFCRWLELLFRRKN